MHPITTCTVCQERDELAALKALIRFGNIRAGGGGLYEQRNEIRLVYTNAGFFALHHGSEEYWSGQSKNPADWLTPEDRHLFWDEFDSVVQKKKEQGSVIYRIVGEDGKLHWVSNQFRPAEQVDGVQYYYASFIDMDKQIAAEQELLRDKQMYDRQNRPGFSSGPMTLDAPGDHDAERLYTGYQQNTRTSADH